MTQRLPVPGSDDGSWGDILNGYLSVVHNTDGTLKSGIVTTNEISTTANITRTQLSASVQTSLGKADSAIQTIPAATTSTAGVVQLGGDLAGTGSTSASPQLVATGVWAGTWGNTRGYFPTLTVDAKGRLTSISNGQAYYELVTTYTSTTDSTTVGQWTPVLGTYLMALNTSIEVIAILNATGTSEAVSSAAKIRLKISYTGSNNTIPSVDCAIIYSSGTITASNLKASVSNQYATSSYGEVDVYLQITESNRRYGVRIETVSQSDTTNTNYGLPGTQGFSSSAPTNSGLFSFKYDPLNPASSASIGGVALAGDLGGTAALPSVPGLTLKAPLASPAFTGVPTAPTPASNDSSTRLATTQWVQFNSGVRVFGLNGLYSLMTGSGRPPTGTIIHVGYDSSNWYSIVHYASVWRVTTDGKAEPMNGNPIILGTTSDITNLRYNFNQSGGAGFNSWMNFDHRNSAVVVQADWQANGQETLKQEFRWNNLAGNFWLWPGPDTFSVLFYNGGTDYQLNGAGWTTMLFDTWDFNGLNVNYTGPQMTLPWAGRYEIRWSMAVTNDDQTERYMQTVYNITRGIDFFVGHPGAYAQRPMQMTANHWCNAGDQIQLAINRTGSGNQWRLRGNGYDGYKPRAEIKYVGWR